MSKMWKILPKISSDITNQFPEYSPLFIQLLYNRGIRTQKQVDEFVNPDYEQDLHDSYLLPDIKKVVDRIFKAKEKDEKVTIYGDYDVDGVAATVLMTEVLQNLGIDVDYYIPHRVKEGYGLNKEAIKEICRNTDLLVTVDCGITNIGEVWLANKLGMEVIITDHHRILTCPSKRKNKLPKAFAIINPKREDSKYPHKELSGVGVAFKLAQALYSDKRASKLGINPQQEKWLLDLVVLGTIADCSLLYGENRTLVKYGLLVLRKTRRLGLQKLIQKSGINLKNLDTYSVGFYIVPRLNAAGRLEHADIAYKLLTSNDELEADILVAKLNRINQERQQITDRIVLEVKNQIGDRVLDEKVLVACGKNWPSGVVGLVAARLCEEYSRPVLILENKGKESAGSARSVSKFNIIEAISESSDILLKFGGHSQAAGFTLRTENVKILHERILEKANKILTKKDFLSEIIIDAKIDPKDINWDVLNEIQRLEPFGEGNSKPVFLLENLRVEDVRLVGLEQKHLKLQLSTYNRRHLINAIGFNKADLARNLEIGDNIDLVFELDVDEWDGNRQLQLKIIDLRIHTS